MVTEGKIEKLSARRINKALSFKDKGFSLRVYKSIDSTNTEATRLIRLGKLKNGLLVADTQTAGRGRSGHTFYSPDSVGIYMSYVFTPESPFDAARITTKAAVCITGLLEQEYGLSPSIKWVNDIYLNDRKIAGILTELIFPITESSEKGTGSIVVGIGINLVASDFPDEIKDIAGALFEAPTISRNEFIGKLSSRLHKEFEKPDDISYMEDYRRLSMLTGYDITYFEGETQKSGHVLEIDDEAGLIIENPDGTKTVLRNGEVNTVRKKQSFPC